MVGSCARATTGKKLDAEPLHTAIRNERLATGLCTGLMRTAIVWRPCGSTRAYVMRNLAFGGVPTKGIQVGNGALN